MIAVMIPATPKKAATHQADANQQAHAGDPNASIAT